MSYNAAIGAISPLGGFFGGGGSSSKGPTAEQKDIQTSQIGFMHDLQKDFGITFAGQQNIIQALTKSFTNTLEGGPSQFGFSQPEVAALNTSATSNIAQQYQNAKMAAGEAAAATGQGGATLPTGSQGVTQAQLADQAAKTESNALLGIQEAGYKQGVQNYNESASGLISTAGLENPQGYASAANNAGEAAASTAAQIQKEQAAASPWGQVGGLVGSLAGAALSAFVPGAGAASGALSAGTSTLGSLGKGALDFSPAKYQGDIGTGSLSGGNNPFVGVDTSLFQTNYNVGQG